MVYSWNAFLKFCNKKTPTSGEAKSDVGASTYYEKTTHAKIDLSIRQKKRFLGNGGHSRCYGGIELEKGKNKVRDEAGRPRITSVPGFQN